MPAQFDAAWQQMLAQPAIHLYGNDVMYVSQPSDNEIVVYKRKRNGFNLKFYEGLTSGLSSPRGMVATPDGRLFVANSGDSNVLVYRTTHSGPQGPTATLHDDGEVPVNVDATPDRRLVAVSNGSTTSGRAGSVSIYLNRALKPSRTLTYGRDPIQGEGVAIDPSGNCYWAFNDPITGTGSIVEFAGCSGNGSLFEHGILNAGGMSFDKRGDLYYVDQLAGIYKCTGPSSCSLFLSIGGLGGLVLPINVNFDKNNPPNLWVADAAGYIDAVDVLGVITYTLKTVGGVTNPPSGIAPAPGS
jgi:streptogramin lyase